MSVQAFNDFIHAITTESSDPASDSSLASEIGNFDKSLTGEAKGMAAMEQLAKVAQSKGYDVSMDDVIEFMRSLKVKYETDGMTKAMMDSYCSTTCHLATQVGK